MVYRDSGAKGQLSREGHHRIFLQKHLEPWVDGRDWRIVLADDCTSHRGDNVFEFCWSRGYVYLLHGAGSTPVGQTVDTDLNEHVRKEYGQKEQAQTFSPSATCKPTKLSEYKQRFQCSSQQLRVYEQLVA